MNALRAFIGRFAALRPSMRAYTSMVDAGLVERRATSAEDEDTVVERVMRAYTLAKQAQQGADAAYQPGAIWARVIADDRRAYRSALEARDREALANLLASFFRNEGVAGIWGHGYFGDVQDVGMVGKRVFAESVLADVETWRTEVSDADLSTLRPPPVGNPWGVVVDGQLVMPVSPRHGYYVDRVQELLAENERPVVAEIGGGFGGFAYLLLKAVPGCRYIGFDLPEVLLVASYFLIRSLPERRVHLYGETPAEECDVTLLPQFELTNLPDSSVDLFVNTGSLSEMDRETVTEYVAQITRTCRGFFFHENSDRGPVAGGDTEVPASEFGISSTDFEQLSERRSPWGGHDSRYREYLYRRSSRSE